MDSGQYLERLLAFFRGVVNPDAVWRADEFKNFWSNPSTPIGVIQTTGPDPREPAQFIASVVLEEKLGPPDRAWAPNPAYRDPSRPSPLVMVTWSPEFSEQSSPAAKLAWMIGEAANALHRIHQLPSAYEPFDENVYTPDEYIVSRLDTLSGAIDATTEDFEWPFENDERQLVCIVAGIEAVATPETFPLVEGLVRLLETVFVDSGKGKLVFVGDKDSEAINCLSNSNRRKVVVIYEDDGRIYRPEDSEIWNLNM